VGRQDQSMSIHDISMAHEMSTLDIKKEMSHRTMIERGAIGAAGGALEDNSEDNGGMLFETPPSDAQLKDRPNRKTFSRSMTKQK